MLTLLTAGWLELCLQPLAALCQFAVPMPTAEPELSVLSNTLCQNALAQVQHLLKQRALGGLGAWIKLDHLYENGTYLEMCLTSSE